jgi:hypothetical protein
VGAAHSRQSTTDERASSSDLAARRTRTTPLERHWRWCQHEWRAHPQLPLAGVREAVNGDGSLTGTTDDTLLTRTPSLRWSPAHRTRPAQNLPPTRRHGRDSATFVVSAPSPRPPKGLGEMDTPEPLAPLIGAGAADDRTAQVTAPSLGLGRRRSRGSSRLEHPAAWSESAVGGLIRLAATPFRRVQVGGVDVRAWLDVHLRA